jgi:hypothetical protein
MKVRCLICEEPFDQLEEAMPYAPVGGVAVTLDAVIAGIFPTVTDRQLTLRGFLCDDCIYAKGKNGLFHLVRTIVQSEYETWKPR